MTPQAAYGMPRTVNSALANFTSRQDAGPNPPAGPNNRNFRFSHRGDIIPNLLTKANGRFESQHITPSFLINSDNIRTPTPSDISIVLDDEDVPLNTIDIIGAHRRYINNISACDRLPPVGPILTIRQVEIAFGFERSTYNG
jgi:hypothetical protein